MLNTATPFSIADTGHVTTISVPFCSTVTPDSARPPVNPSAMMNAERTRRELEAMALINAILEKISGLRNQ